MAYEIEQVRDNSPAPVGVDPSQWSANPYANYDYRHSWWQSLIEGIGLRSKWDAYRENMALNSAEYKSQLMEKAHNEQFDSPVEQNARLRSAGINPDLAGETSSGSSSPMEPDPNAPIASEPDNPMATLATFTNLIMSGFTGAIGLANNIVGLLGNVEDVQSKGLSNRSTVVNDAITWALNHIPDVYPSEVDTAKGKSAWNGVIDAAGDYASEYGYRSRDARLFERTVRDYLNSAPGSAEAYEAWYKHGKARAEWAGMYGSSLFSESDETLRAVLDPIIKATDRVRHLKPQTEGDVLASDSSQAQYNEDLYDNLDPNLAAQVENTTNRRNIHSANIDSILNECMDEIISNLRDKSESGKKGHNFATAALLIFSLLRMTNFHPSFSTSSGVTQKGTSFSSSSFGF